MKNTNVINLETDEVMTFVNDSPPHAIILFPLSFLQIKMLYA